MAQVVIENPIINSPFDEPQRHFNSTTTASPTRSSRAAGSAPTSSPSPSPRRRASEAACLRHRVDAGPRRGEQVHQRHPRRVALWRKGGYVGVTPTTARLLEYWHRPDRERQLFFCQIEALETAIYITEVAKKYGDAWIENALREANEDAEPRPAPHRLQDGHRLRQDRGHGDAHRLADAQQAGQPAGRPLHRHLPDRHPRHHHPRPAARPAAQRPGQLLPQLDMVPPTCMDELGQAKIVITNFHAFLLREKVAAGKLTKEILGRRASPARSPRRPTRWCAASAGSWAPRRTSSSSTTRPTTATAASRTATDEKLTGDERKEAEQRDEEARVWITGLEAVKAKIGVKAVYDLSATPFFLRGSGYPEGTLFPWVVSDFSLIDAIESGHRQGAARAGGRQLDDRRAAHLPRPLGAHPRRPAEEGPQDRRRRAASRSCPSNWKGRCRASTATTRSTTACGRQNAEARGRWH